MNYYQHHIGDFNNATRHLTRVERALYRDLIELYYDTEQALTGDVTKLQRRVLAHSDDEKQALDYVLSEFFTLESDGFHNSRCDREIEKYRANNSAKARAGKASAEARKRRKEQNLTPVEQPLNGCGTNEQLTSNHKPITNNQEPVSNNHTSTPNGVNAPPTPFKEIVDLYHETLPDLRGVKSLNNKRKAAMRQRHIGIMERDLASWKSYFEAVSQTDFLMGRVEGKRWRADFDFLLTEKATTGVLEGKYHEGF